MEILSSGSFVILENREKIEQLIFHGKRDCKGSESSRGEGLVNTAQTN
jgi:hypothetical protein